MLAQLLELDAVKSRIQSAIASIQPEHIYESRPLRKSRIAGSGAKMIVLNSQNVAVLPTSDPETAEGKASVYPGRTVIDMSDVNFYDRVKIQNALARRMGSTKFEPPKPRLAPEFLGRQDPIDRTSEYRRELWQAIQKLSLSKDQKREVYQALLPVLQSISRSAALDLVYEFELLEYTDVLDIATGERWGFETSSEAADFAKFLRESGDDFQHIKKFYRYKTVKPEVTA